MTEDRRRKGKRGKREVKSGEKSDERLEDICEERYYYEQNSRENWQKKKKKE